jgi:hypothetical protein
MSAVPITQYTWYINGIEIRPSDRMRVVQEGRTIVLIIINVGVMDSGEYMLRVVNDLGEVTCRTTLVVEGRCCLLNTVHSNMKSLELKLTWSV